MWRWVWKIIKWIIIDWILTAIGTGLNNGLVKNR